MDARHNALEQIARELSKRHTRHRLIREEGERGEAADPSHIIASGLDRHDVEIIARACRQHSGRVPLEYLIKSAPDAFEGQHLVVEIE